MEKISLKAFDQMIEKLQNDSKKIVFTEGTDARILEASAELLKDGILTDIGTIIVNFDIQV